MDPTVIPWICYGIFFIISRIITGLAISYLDARGSPDEDCPAPMVIMLLSPLIGEAFLVCIILWTIFYYIPEVMIDRATQYFRSRFEKQRKTLAQQAKILELQELRLKTAERELEMELDSLRASLQRNT
jgi:hypothetical protein